MSELAERYSIVNEPNGEVYRDLLRFLVKQCNEVMLVVREAERKRDVIEHTMAPLRPALIDCRQQGEWPGTKLIGLTAWVYRYRLDDEVCRILGSSVQRLYDWRAPERPEDLIALMDERPVLTTVTHERDAYLDLTDAQVEELADFNSGLRLFRGNIVPRAAEPYRLFGAFLDERSLNAAGSIKAALAEYLGMVSAAKLDEAIATIRDILVSRNDENLLRVILQRWGAAPSLTAASHVSTILVDLVAKMDAHRQKRLS